MEIQRKAAVLADVGQEVRPQSEVRKTLRRPTLATVKARGPGLLDDQALATNLSSEGAFIRSVTQPPEEARFGLRLQLPTDSKPIDLKARVIRKSEIGVGVLFEEVSARDRSRLRSYSGYSETDDTIVRIQQSLGDLVPGNLLPFSDEGEVASILQTACKQGTEVLVVSPGKGFRPATCRITEVDREQADEMLGKALFRLGEMTSPLGKDVRTVYLAFSLAPLYYMCEALVSRPWPNLELLLPDRIYITERRSQLRAADEDTWIELEAPHNGREPIRLSVIDAATGGASVLVPSSAMWLPGTRLPSFDLVGGGRKKRIYGATVQYLGRMNHGHVRAGLRFENQEGRRERLKPRKRKKARSSLGLLRSLSFFRAKMTNLVRVRNGEAESDIEVVRYRNARGDTVAAIVDATFDTSNNTARPDVAVVLAPAILKRKEIFGLFARTILDNLKRENLSGVVLRFDASHIMGESTMDPRLVAEDRPYYNWTFGHLKDDMAASFRYLEHRFQPAHRALISVSLSAIPARKLMVEGDHPPADIWIAPFGCPDAQDMVRNYLAGLDLFPAYEKGEAPESVMIHGRPIRSTALYGQSLEDGMAYLEDAQRDLSSLDVPVCWVLGKHDHWVTHSRVKSMFEAPGGGAREIFEVPTGHVLKGGAEAIELFKLVSETLLKHLFKIDHSAVDPEMSRFVAQSQSEWSRVKRAKLGDSTEFWREHLFGDSGHDEGYDIMLDHPGYPRFLRRQVELLDPKAGEDVADLGCGTGNLSVEILKACRGAIPNSLTYVDLVPDATGRTEQKVIDICAGHLGSEPAHRGVVMDLEVPRLAAVNDFLEGKLWSLEELVGRIEGLESGSARRIQRCYSKELHGALRGTRATAEWVKRAAPALHESDVETVLDISLASRFLKGSTHAEDRKEGVDEAATAEDLAFRRLFFGRSGRSLAFEFPTASFDKVGASLLVPYLYDALAFLSEVHRILRPGGVLVASSIVPNFDPSKTYQEAAEIIRESAGPVAERKLAALRHYGNMVSRLIEFEEDGRFHFHGGAALCSLAQEAGFSEVRAFPAFGSPPTTVIIRARK